MKQTTGSIDWIQLTAFFQSHVKRVSDALLSAQKHFDEDYSCALPWWVRALFLPYMGTGLYFLLYSVVTNRGLFADAYVEGLVLVGALLFGGLGIVGALPALLFWRFLAWIQIPTPVTLILATYASVLGAFFFIAAWLAAVVADKFFEMGVVPITLGGILALLAIPQSQYALITKNSGTSSAMRNVLISAKTNFDRSFFGPLNIVRLPWWVGASLLSCLVMGLSNVMLLRNVKSLYEQLCFQRVPTDFFNLLINLGITSDFSMGVDVGLCGGLSAVLIWNFLTKHSTVMPQGKFVLCWIASLAVGFMFYPLGLVGRRFGIDCQPLLPLLVFCNLPICHYQPLLPLLVFSIVPIWRLLLLASCGGITALLAMPYEQLTSPPNQHNDGSVPSVVNT